MRIDRSVSHNKYYIIYFSRFKLHLCANNNIDNNIQTSQQSARHPIWRHFDSRFSVLKCSVDYVFITFDQAERIRLIFSTLLTNDYGILYYIINFIWTLTRLGNHFLSALTLIVNGCLYVKTLAAKCQTRVEFCFD